MHVQVVLGLLQMRFGTKRAPQVSDLREAACALVGAQSSTVWQLDLVTNEMWVEPYS